MTKKKIILALATSMSILALAACSSETKNTEIATMKGGTITALDFYDNAPQRYMLCHHLTEILKFLVASLPNYTNFECINTAAL